MSVVVWFTVGLALWHFTVFVDVDKLWGGIIGALLLSIAGAVASGLVFQILAGRSVGETDLLTALVAVPGTAAGLFLGYLMTLRDSDTSRA